MRGKLICPLDARLLFIIDLFHVMSQTFHVYTNNLVILVYSCHVGTHSVSVK